jgi:hypothetical protein
LRDYTDFDILEESAVRDGALNRYRVAVLFEGTVWDAKTLASLRSWVEGGGVLLAYDFGKMADQSGNTSVYQALFGFASTLQTTSGADQWIGDKSLPYHVNLGGTYDQEVLLGNWLQASEGVRNASNGAVMRLPYFGKEPAVVTLHLGPGTDKVQSVKLSSGGRTLAGVGLAGGLKQITITVDTTSIINNVLSLEISGLEAGANLPVDSIDVSESDSVATLKPLAGRYEADVEIAKIRQWTRPVGQGLVVFFPGRRDQWKSYISVVRHAVFRLSSIAAERKNAPPLDDTADGVFTVDLGDRIALYNSTGSLVKRSFTLAGSEVQTQVSPASLKIVSPAPEPIVDIVQLEAFATGAMLKSSSPTASGDGDNLVRVSPGQVLNVVVRLPHAGRYRLFARTLRAGQLFPASWRIGDTEAGRSALSPQEDFYMVGEFDLPAGDVALAISASEAFLGDCLVLTDLSGTTGFRFPSK